MIMKTNELTGGLLDYWTAMASEVWKTAHQHFSTMTLDPTFSGVEYREFGYVDNRKVCVLVPSNPFRQDCQQFNPSESWEHGGPLIENYSIDISENFAPDMGGNNWNAHTRGGNRRGRARGAAPLIAICRAIVASKYGDEVPDEV